MTRVFYASTLFGALSLVTALDAGIFGDRDERRVLIASTNVAVPEIATPFYRSPAFAPLRDRFDEIVDWNDLIAPMHPSHWSPRAAEQPMLARLLADRLGLGDGVRELVLESIAVAPSRTIGSLIRGCPITVYSDGLMSYGPTRDDLPAGIGRRAGRLLYLDLVPGLTPLLLREYEVAPVALPSTGFQRVVDELPPPDVGAHAGCPVILGQYLSQIGIVTEQEEFDLHDRMLDAIAARGHRRVVFRPHPAARRTHAAALLRHAAATGVELHVPDDGLPAEAWIAAARPELVVSCFSTALFTAQRFYGCQVATVGTDLVLDRITPYENSNRIPATITDASLPRLHDDGSIIEPAQLPVAELMRSVGFCMQSNRLHDLREPTASYLAEHGATRYFKRRRLESVGLVAPPPAKPLTGRRLARGASRRAVAATRAIRRRQAG